MRRSEASLLSMVRTTVTRKRSLTRSLTLRLTRTYTKYPHSSLHRLPPPLTSPGRRATRRLRIRSECLGSHRGRSGRRIRRFRREQQQCHADANGHAAEEWRRRQREGACGVYDCRTLRVVCAGERRREQQRRRRGGLGWAERGRLRRSIRLERRRAEGNQGWTVVRFQPTWQRWRWQ